MNINRYTDVLDSTMVATDWTWIKVPRQTRERLREARHPDENSFHMQIDGLLDLEAELKMDMGF